MSEWRVGVYQGLVMILDEAGEVVMTRDLTTDDMQQIVADHNARLTVPPATVASEVVAAVDQYVCGYCQNRIGFDPEPATSPYPAPCKVGGCAPLRTALAAARPMRQAGAEIDVERIRFDAEMSVRKAQSDLETVRALWRGCRQANGDLKRQLRAALATTAPAERGGTVGDEAGR